jgi:hypothetical protein
MESAANELNLGALLPELGTTTGLIRLCFALMMLAGPLVVLAFGLLYKYKPPKEANYSLGYRFWWGMASLDSWTYNQSIAGKIFVWLGLILSGVMLIAAIVFLFLDLMTMAMLSVLCLLVELVAIGGACIAINMLVMKKFDKDGYRRDEIA